MSQYKKVADLAEFHLQHVDSYSKEMPRSAIGVLDDLRGAYNRIGELRALLRLLLDTVASEDSRVRQIIKNLEQARRDRDIEHEAASNHEQRIAELERALEKQYFCSFNEDCDQAALYCLDHAREVIDPLGKLPAP